jgi:hypothetical protein
VSEPSGAGSSGAGSGVGAGAQPDPKDAKVDLEKLAEKVYKLLMADARMAQVRGDQTKRR